MQCVICMSMERWCQNEIDMVKNEFICKELYAPFKIDKDTDYRNDLEKKYKIVMEQAKRPMLMMKA